MPGPINTPSGCSVDSKDLEELLTSTLRQPLISQTNSHLSPNENSSEVSNTSSMNTMLPGKIHDAQKVSRQSLAPSPNHVLELKAAASALVVNSDSQVGSEGYGSRRSSSSGATSGDIIDLVDSSDDEDQGVISFPTTARKRFNIIDSDDDDEDDDSNEIDLTDSPDTHPQQPSTKVNTTTTTSKPASSSSSLSWLPALKTLFSTPPRPSKPSAAIQPSKPSAVEQQPSIKLPTALTSTKSTAANNFKKERETLAKHLYSQFNTAIFGGKLPDNLEIKWNNRLATTAGITHYRREIPAASTTARYSAHIELSSKVIDALPKLERTLCHEMCHVAAWLLDHTAKPPHGDVFKKWASKAMSIYRHLDITTCHQYDIFYAFRWQCTGCHQEYGRHSNSIDVTKKVCGQCKAPLQYLGKFKPDGSVVVKRQPTAFSAFVKENYQAEKAKQQPNTPMSEVMKALSRKWHDKQHSQSQQKPNNGQQQQQAQTAAAVAGDGVGSNKATMGGRRLDMEFGANDFSFNAFGGKKEGFGTAGSSGIMQKSFGTTNFSTNSSNNYSSAAAAIREEESIVIDLTRLAI